MPETATWDAVTPPRIHGVDSGETVTIRAETDVWFDDTGSVEVTFVADDDGVVDLGEQAPIHGDYDGVASMGWVWALHEEQVGDASPTGNAADVPITVEAHVDGECRASVTTTRRRAAPNVDHRRVTTDSVVGDLFLPSGDVAEDGNHDADAGSIPGVVLLHGSGGQPLRGTGAAIAGHGVAALAVQYFGRPDSLPDALSEVPVERVDQAADWLAERPSVDGGRLALFGRSKGAELALSAAGRFDWPRALVLVAPTRYRWQALDRAETPTGSWTADGDVLPFVPFRAAPGKDGDLVVYRDTYAGSVERADPAELDAARLPVDDVDPPTLLVSGGDDQMWPAGEAAATLANDLQTADVTVEHRHYPDAGHGISVPYTPTNAVTASGGMALGDDPAADARAAADHWPAVVEHLTADRRR